MDFEEARDNLRAIRLLYRLLEDNSIALQDSNSENVSVFVMHASFFFFFFAVDFNLHLIVYFLFGNKKFHLLFMKHPTET